MGNLTVAVLAGGRSAEHDVSLRSAQAVVDGLHQAGYRVRQIVIDREGGWFYEEKQLSLMPGEGLLDVDVVFPVLHGPYGEDGTVQGFLELLDVPYVGSGVAASAVCIDKVLAKDLFATANIPQVSYVGLLNAEWQASMQPQLERIKQLGFPVFVKPARMGSSFGITRVTSSAELPGALAQAFLFDERVIIEAASPGIEVECALWQEEGEVKTSMLGEIALPERQENGWYDHAAKYSEGGMELIAPARISRFADERLREIAKEAFYYVGCRGLARVDFFVEEDHVLLNEINTMPGFTATSVYPKLWSKSGVGFAELVSGLCVEAFRQKGGMFEVIR